METVKYKHGLKDKMRDRGYCEAVSSIVRSCVVGLCVFALFVFVIYILLALPSLKAESLARFKRLKENALNKPCVAPLPPPPPPKQAESKTEVEMCDTPHGAIRCNHTSLDIEIEEDNIVMKVSSLECDEDTMYYRHIDVEYEARVEALLRLMHMEAKVCGPTCLYWIHEITDGVTNHPPLSVLLLTITLMVFEWSVLDCHKGRKRVRAALDKLATKPPSFLHTNNEKQD